MSLNWSQERGWYWAENEKKYDDPLNQAYRAGGGWKNPNVERLREGKAPLNMDGTVYRP